MICARPNPFQQMVEKQQENSGAFFAEIEAYVKKYKTNNYEVKKHHGIVAAHKMDYRREAMSA